MIVYRIARTEYADLGGEGASLFPGRWNRAGVACIYSSSSPSLAQLEVMVNTEDWTLFARLDFVLLVIEADKSRLTEFTSADLPANWDSAGVIEETQEFGTVQFNSRSKVGFSVPSVVTPQEKNIILNPGAENFTSSVKIISSSVFRIDDRLIS